MRQRHGASSGDVSTKSVERVNAYLKRQVEAAGELFHVLLHVPAANDDGMHAPQPPAASSDPALMRQRVLLMQGEYRARTRRVRLHLQGITTPHAHLPDDTANALPEPPPEAGAIQPLLRAIHTVRSQLDAVRAGGAADAEELVALHSQLMQLEAQVTLMQFRRQDPQLHG